MACKNIIYKDFLQFVMENYEYFSKGSRESYDLAKVDNGKI